MLCLATALNYLDRQTLSVLAGTIKEQLHISTVQYSYITSSFLISYTIMYAVSGRIVDWLGSRKSFMVFVSGWSLANVLHAFAQTTLQFSFFRFLLGATEPANFPAGIKAVTEWFPMRERALAVGIFNSGTAIGSTLAAPIVAWCALTWDWRSAFVVGGILGGIWVIAWAFVYQLPRNHPRLSPEELQLIEADDVPQEVQHKSAPIMRILSTREAWGCILARFFTDPLSYLFIFWIPLFLQQERGFDLKEIGMYGWIPYVVMTIGNILGGAIPNYLVRRGWTLNRARKTMMLIASILMPTSFILITRVHSPAWAIVFISVAMFCHALWANITLPAEVFEKHVVGSVTGFGGAVGSLVSAASMLLIGQTVAVKSFTPIFVIYSTLPITAFILVCILIKELGHIRKIPA
jgi:ACS family hexuronate transporter-like MFS transporter